MRTKKSACVSIMICIAILLIAFAGCASEEEVLWVYKPMISIGDDLFGDTGYTTPVLSDEWELLGTVEQEVSQTEPMVKGETHYIANDFPVGTELYGSEAEPDVIYAKYNDTFIRYELMEE